MELFDKKFVRFMWDNELEGKVCFVAANIADLIFAVRNDGKGAIKTNALRYSGNDVRPFHAYVLGENCSYPFAYYDPNYEAERSFNEGKEIQFKDDVTGEWCLAHNPRWDLNIEYRVKPEEKWIAYLARPENGDCYLSACTDTYWEAVQKNNNAKTKLFIGSESDAQRWYESRQKFTEIIKAWEDGKQLQFRPKDPHLSWQECGNPSWDVDLEYRVKPEEKTVVVKRCSGCIHEHCSATKEPCVSCKPDSCKYEAKEEMEDKMNPMQGKKMRRYNLKVKDWNELKESAVKMFKEMAALNERFAEKISKDGFITQDDWKMMNDLWKTFNYTNNDNQICKDDLHHLFTEDDLDEEFVEIKAEEAKE